MSCRSIEKNFMLFGDLYETLKTYNRKYGILLVGIDGFGGSGKSTFAKELSEEGQDIAVVHMDDFYLPSALRSEGEPGSRPVGSDFDWKRLKREVIDPLIDNKEIKYQIYDWNTDTISNWKLILPGGIVIIEGVYSTRNELADFYDFRIWIDCPRELRLKRGLLRDGEISRTLWETKWIVEEEKYIQEHKPHRRADLYVDGSKFNRHYKLTR